MAALTEGNGSDTARLGVVTPLAPGDPERIGRYQVLGRLGAGGMGSVYLARAVGDRSTAPLVAVKVVHPELVGDAEFRARFRDEVAAARRVAPFCTARMLDADPDADPPYLVTEYVDGLPLGQVVAERGALSDSTVHGVALGVAAALAAIHGAGLVHRDLKPANVLLSLSGPRVIDFGIARALDATAHLTMAGTVLGTPGWMAPEQFRGGAVGSAADVFSWGSLVAYAATGRLPWGDEGPPTAFAYRILHSQPDLAGLTGPLRRLVEAALSKDPARRPTARDLVLALLGGDVAGAAPNGLPADPTAAATAAAGRLLGGGWLRPTAGSNGPATNGGPPVPRAPAAGPPASRTPAARAAAHFTAAQAAERAVQAARSARLAGGTAQPPGRTAAIPPRTRVLPPRTFSAPPVGSSRRTPGPAGAVPPPAGAAPRVRTPTRPTSVLPPATAAGRPGRRGGAPASWTPYGYQPPRLRKRRRWYRRKRYLLPLGLLVLLAVASSRQQPEDQPDSAGQQPSPSAGALPADSAGPAPDSPAVGGPVRDGQLEFVLTSWRCGVDRVGKGRFTHRAHGEFCLGTLDAKNIGDKSRTLFERYEKLIDTSGNEFPADFGARFYISGQTLWSAIDPGESGRGTLVFDVPLDAEPDRLELHDGLLSGGISLPLR